MEVMEDQTKMTDGGSVGIKQFYYYTIVIFYASLRRW